MCPQSLQSFPSVFHQHRFILTIMLHWSLFALLTTYPPQILATFSSTMLPPPICTSPSNSQPNPIASDYPGIGIGTGTSNGTLAVIPIDYATARSIVPAQYPILNDTYHQLFPTLTPDMYPVCNSIWVPSLPRERKRPRVEI